METIEAGPAPTGGEVILALDYGGTKLSAAVVSRAVIGASVRSAPPAPNSLAVSRHVKPAGADGAYDRRTMLELAAGLLAGRRPAAIGVSFGGPVAFEEGRVRLSHHVPGWEEQPLAADLERELAAPCVVDNDANVAAIGEHRLGAGRRAESLLYLTISTGVGGGWVLSGAPWRGSEGMAGEFGHITVDPLGEPCVCGGRGCVEGLAAGPNLAQRARLAARERPEEAAVLLGLVGGEAEAIDARHVAAAAAAGDPVAAAALDASATAIGIAIGSTANLMNPRRFVLGGGVTKSGERYWSTLRRVAREHAMPEVTLDIVPAALGDDAPLWGAALLAADRLTADERDAPGRREESARG